MKIKDLNLSDAENWRDTAKEMLARYKNKVIDDVNTYNCRMCKTAVFVGKVSKFDPYYNSERTIRSVICIHCILYDEDKDERCVERFDALRALCQEIQQKEAGSWITKGAMILRRKIFYIKLVETLEEHIKTLKDGMV